MWYKEVWIRLGCRRMEYGRLVGASKQKNIYSHCWLPRTIPLTEGILRLGLNNFQSKVECGEAGRGSVAAEGRWVAPKHFNAVLPFRWQMLHRASFIRFDNHVVYVDD